MGGAELVGPSSVGASEGFLGWIAYLGAANAGAMRYDHTQSHIIREGQGGTEEGDRERAGPGASEGFLGWIAYLGAANAGERGGLGGWGGYWGTDTTHTQVGAALRDWVNCTP